MKKFTLMLVAALAMLSPVKAQDAQRVLTYQWAHTVEGAGTASNNVFEAKKATDGNYFVATKVGTKTGTLTAKFDGVAIDGFEGATYSNSTAGNLYLQKVKADGSVVWTVRSAKVDVSATNIAPTSDGGAILVVKSRVENKDGETAKVLTLIDAANNTVEVGDANTVVKVAYATIVKLDKNGKCEWTRLVPGVKANKATDVLTVTGCAVDAEDNVYVAGKLAGTATFATSESETQDVTSQNSTSDLVVLKLDKNGSLVSSLLPTDNAKVSSQVDAVAFNNGILYLAGQVKGTGLKIGGKEIAGDATFSSLYLAAVNTANLEVNYAKHIAPIANANATKPAFVLQNKALDFINGNLYLTGSVNGGLAADDVTANTNSTVLKGMVVKVQASDGKLLSVGLNDQKEKGISNYFGVYEGENTVYAFGYDMLNTSGMVLFTYDKTTLAKQNEIKVTNLTNGNNAPMLVDGKNLLMMARGNKTAPLTFEGTTANMDGFTDWGVVYCLYTISDVSTAIKSISSATDASSKVNVYTLSGVCVKKNVSAAEATQGLAKGIYVVGNKKVVVK